jgi:hypothetical protein
MLIAVVDESETITIFEPNSSKPKAQSKIKVALGLPDSLKKKDLFGLGYPYLICAYNKHVAVTSDFGICLLSYE